MSRRASLFIAVLFGWGAAANLSAQPPTQTSGTSTSPVPSVTPQTAPTPTTKSLVDSMDSADLKEAIQLLKNNYIKPEAWNETELNRAAFEGILTRLGRGVVLLSNASGELSEPAAPFYGEILDGHVGY